MPNPPFLPPQPACASMAKLPPPVPSYESQTHSGKADVRAWIPFQITIKAAHLAPTRTGDGFTEQFKGTLSSQTCKSHFCTTFQCSSHGRHFGGRSEVFGRYQCDQQCGTRLTGAFSCSTPCSPQGPHSETGIVTQPNH